MESWRLYHWSSSGGKRLLSTIHAQMQSGVHQALHWPFWLSREWGTLNILVEKVKTAFLKAAWVNDKLHKPSTLLDVLKNPCGMNNVLFNDLQSFPSGLWVAAQSLFINETLQTQTHMYVYNKTLTIYTNWREGLSELTKSKKCCFITCSSWCN